MFEITITFTLNLHNVPVKKRPLVKLSLNCTLKPLEIIPNFSPFVSYVLMSKKDYLALLNTAHSWNS